MDDVSLITYTLKLAQGTMYLCFLKGGEAKTTLVVWFCTKGSAGKKLHYTAGFK